MHKEVTILTREQIESYLPNVNLIPLIEQGFNEYSKGNSIVPPVGELLFEEPPGDVHIKYGYIKDQEYYVVKIASGFYNNTNLGISNSQGVMLLFSQKSGVLKCVLLDEGILTDIRTVIASMITIKYLAPPNVSAIGIIGTGTQAKLQLEYLHLVSNCKNIFLWGRNYDHVQRLKKTFDGSDYNIKIATTPESLASACQIIISTTSSTSPILNYNYINPGTHITALGSDTNTKIELSPEILSRADIVVVDSIPQSRSRGEVFRARESDAVTDDKILELGDIILDPSKEDQIRIKFLSRI